MHLCLRQTVLYRSALSQHVIREKYCQIQRYPTLRSINCAAGESNHVHGEYTERLSATYDSTTEVTAPRMLFKRITPSVAHPESRHAVQVSVYYSTWPTDFDTLARLCRRHQDSDSVNRRIPGSHTSQPHALSHNLESSVIDPLVNGLQYASLTTVSKPWILRADEPTKPIAILLPPWRTTHYGLRVLTRPKTSRCKSRT